MNSLGARTMGYVPVRQDNRLIGLLIVHGPATEAEVIEILPAVIEFADLAGALIGRDVAGRNEAEKVRVHISGIISGMAFAPVFQPIVHLGLDSIVGYEALTRFEDGTNPEVAFAEAASVGLGAELEMATLRAALKASESLPQSAWLNVNASPELILAGEPLRSLLRRSSRPLVVEVTEHAAIADYPAFRTSMSALGPNVRFAVDDAGAGFSSLRHILEVRPAFVKLDRWLVSGIETDEARKAMIVGLRHFARATGCQLIAEGIETDREFATLRSLDISLGQGYLLGRPKAVAAAEPASDRSPRERVAAVGKGLREAAK
jgi:EAL domain-containing protein (putative c-di-GMP-specific phosphodiesterase class I)